MTSVLLIFSYILANVVWYTNIFYQTQQRDFKNITSHFIILHFPPRVFMILYLNQQNSLCLKDIYLQHDLRTSKIDVSNKRRVYKMNTSILLLYHLKKTHVLLDWSNGFYWYSESL